MNFMEQLTAKVGGENVAAAVLALEAAGAITVDRSRPDAIYIEASPALVAATRGTTADYWKQRRDRSLASIPEAIRA